ncbi:MAG: hypothetical protein U0798_13280 [Gemmataceae bacterium]
MSHVPFQNLVRSYLWIAFALLLPAGLLAPRAHAQSQSVKRLLPNSNSELDQDRGVFDFFSAYSKAYPTRKARYSSNRKIEWIEKTFIPLRPTPEMEVRSKVPLQLNRVNYLANNQRHRVEMTISTYRDFDDHPHIARVWDAKSLTTLRWNPELKKYEHRKEKILQHTDQEDRQVYSGLPFLLKWYDLEGSLYAMNPYIHHGMNDETILDVVKMEPCRWKNRSLMKVTFQTAQSMMVIDPQMPLRTFFGYFDPDHAWICHGMEAEPLPSDCVPQIKKYINWIDFKDGAEGYPVPARITKAAEFTDGALIPFTVIEVESFERAFPNDEECSLEHYGDTIAVNDHYDSSTYSIVNNPIVKKGHWKWLIPVGFVLMSLGVFIGRLASKSQRSEPEQHTTCEVY